LLALLAGPALLPQRAHQSLAQGGHDAAQFTRKGRTLADVPIPPLIHTHALTAHPRPMRGRAARGTSVGNPSSSSSSTCSGSWSRRSGGSRARAPRHPWRSSRSRLCACGLAERFWLSSQDNSGMPGGPSASSPRVLSIQSHVVHGYVGNKCAVFPLQVSACPATSGELRAHCALALACIVRRGDVLVTRKH